MDHVGGYINPLTLIRRLPKGLAVPRLRDRLRRIIGDFRTQTSLHEGCNGILSADCMHLMHRYVSCVWGRTRGRDEQGTSSHVTM